VNEEDFPDFLQVNNFRAKPGMFAAPRKKPDFAVPTSTLNSNPAGPFGRVLYPQLGPGAPPPPMVGYSPFPPPAAAAARCPLVPLNLKPGSVAGNGADLRFSPAFADVVSRAADTLNQQGIRLEVNEGFRTAADQWRMRHGGSGKNPAAEYSDHQLGNAVDINGTKLSSFPLVIRAFEQAGARWGGDYRGQKDRPHFYIRPVRANAINTAECERENPR